MTTQQHKSGTGFGAHSTADDVLAGIDLSRKTALVTGGYSGLGLETTLALIRAGAHVIVPARRSAAAEEALRGVPRAEVHVLDLADLESVRTFSVGFLETGRTLDLVINGAGIMACPETRVGPGWEAHFAVNHLGHFALVNRLRPALTEGARVVSVASSGHFLSDMRWDDLHFRDGYDRWLAYAQSKTANALFAVHLDALGADSGLHAFAVHPGSILTPLQRHIPRDEQMAQGWITPDGTAGSRIQDMRRRARRRLYGLRHHRCSTATVARTVRTATSPTPPTPTTCSSVGSSPGPSTRTRHPGSGNSPASSPSWTCSPDGSHPVNGPQVDAGHDGPDAGCVGRSRPRPHLPRASPRTSSEPAAEPLVDGECGGTGMFLQHGEVVPRHSDLGVRLTQSGAGSAPGSGSRARTYSVGQASGAGFQSRKSSKYPAMAVSRSGLAEANSAARRSMSDVIVESACSWSP